MKSIRFTLMAAALLLATSASLVSCGSSNLMTDKQINKQTAQLRQGMTMDEVQQLLGDPNDRRLIDGHETWRWTKYIMMDQNYKIIEVGFLNGKVEYFNTFSADSAQPPHPHHY